MRIEAKETDKDNKIMRPTGSLTSMPDSIEKQKLGSSRRV